MDVMSQVVVFHIDVLEEVCLGFVHGYLDRARVVHVNRSFLSVVVICMLWSNRRSHK